MSAAVNWSREEAPGRGDACESGDAREVVHSLNALAFQVRRVADLLDAQVNGPVS